MAPASIIRILVWCESNVTFVLITQVVLGLRGILPGVVVVVAHSDGDGFVDIDGVLEAGRCGGRRRRG